MEISLLAKIQTGSGVCPLQWIHQKDSLRAKPSGPNLNTFLYLNSFFLYSVSVEVISAMFMDDTMKQWKGLEIQMPD
jgi:hypothetical protein